MSDQQNPLVTANVRPTTDNRADWIAYWVAQGMPWRTESEIEEARRQQLAERREIEPHLEQGIFPFKDTKLDRADVEWLLATHESGGMRGPVDWSDERQRTRVGLDLRGVDMEGADLSRLPLARSRFGAFREDLTVVFAEVPDLEQPELFDAPRGLLFSGARLSQADLYEAHLEHAGLFGAVLEQANLTDAHLEGAFLGRANLEGAILARAHLEDAFAQGTNLQGVVCVETRFEHADLRSARLDGGLFFQAHLQDADVRFASLSGATSLNGVTLGSSVDGVARLADVNWGGASLALVRWVEPIRLRQLGTRATDGGTEDRRSSRRIVRSRALRASRQIARELRNQGLNDQADRFAYRAQRLQRRVHLSQRRYLRYVGSLLLDLVSGYGYLPLRSFIAYVVVILAFASAYFIFGGVNGQPLPWNEAIVISMTAFHGRGFFSAVFQPGDLQAAVAAVEAFIGLLIEIVLIATFTQRFFAR